METRKDQLDAAKKLVGKNIGPGGIEEMIRISGYLHGLQDLEEGYEILGGRIADNLDDADKLDKRYRKLNEKAREEEEMKSQKGKKGGKGKKAATSGRAKKDQSGDEADVDEDVHSQGRGKKSRKRRKKTGKYENLDDDVLVGTSEGDETELGSKQGKDATPAKAISISRQASDTEGEETKVAGASKQGEAPRDSGASTSKQGKAARDSGGGTSKQKTEDARDGGGKDRKRAKVKDITTSEDSGGEERTESEKSSQQVAQGRESDGVSGTTKLVKSKDKRSKLEIKMQPQSQSSDATGGRLSSPEGHAGESSMGVANVAAESLEGEDVKATVGGDSNSQDLARLNRQDARTQARGIQTLAQHKDFDRDDFEIVNDVVCKPAVLSHDQSVQTDDAVLFSLMESLMQEMPNDEHWSNMEDEPSELKRLRREVKKANMQLRFWRSRNWVERHSRLYPSGGKTAHPVVDSPSEAGFSFYFNAVKAPTLVTHPISYPPTTHTSGSTSRGDNATTPIRAREPHVEALRPPLNAKLMLNTPPPAHARPARTSRRTSSELQSLSAGSGLVIFGRSSTLITAHADAHTAVAHLPTHENRASRLSPRLSGVQYQKA